MRPTRKFPAPIGLDQCRATEIVARIFPFTRIGAKFCVAWPETDNLAGQAGAYVTAEIAIANKSAVALAADSAVSFGPTGTQKIYHTVNKISTLNKYHPVGLMMYGNPVFMDVPLETAIKLYREDKGGYPEDTVQSYANDFLSYIQNDWICRSEQQEHALDATLYNEFMKIYRNALTKVRRHLIKQGRYSSRYVSRTISECISDAITEAQSSANLEEPVITHQKLSRTHRAIVDGAAQRAFRPAKLSAATLRELRRYAACFLNKAIFSDHASGLVVAGFGAEELFPSIVEIKVDGVINGVLRRKIVNIKDVGRGYGNSEISATIVPFAQSEMVYRFMSGVDPKYQEYIQDYVYRMMAEYVVEIVNSTIPVKQRKQCVQSILPLLTKSVEQFKDDMDRRRKKAFHGPILDVVEHLPKEELANMAEALVNLTSLKRKISPEAETVGGPIDVAVISRGDGFIWIKRKHYFSSELNPQFMRTYFERHRKGGQR